ncbi:type IV toxin-antitoxin system AbiEi family antitoxin domain-containing protein [Agromyces archimandritae]|uniref:DUF559 domain-containing protein n=1 Tax=Agromyces archimandritae TaxID=2781962 RepID=A0A975FKW4_9MICO|nr:type IV toxin-antitoxin system AbiEi family antitoxin domain-containing protein [Agromyces archimandritae]QTX03746.1 DUF559 domain-containing protein [Agromyces archimandritae]
MAHTRIPPRHALRRLDGAATTAELRALGVDRSALAAAMHAGDIERIRRGWYALPALDPGIREAIRIGGRLGCVSAAAHHGWATPEHHGLHVTVPATASRLRRADEPPGTVVHWSTTERSTRLVTSWFETLMQIARCASPEHTAAAFDSFLAQGRGRDVLLEQWMSKLPPHIRAALPELEALCHSFLETIGRVRLERCGIRGRHQVEIAGVGRVDLVIDGWLVVEWDGSTHRTAEQYAEDRRRDAMLTAMGYRVLRFDYRTVMDSWYLVIAAVRASLDGAGRAPA